MRVKSDLHIHSILSACCDNDNTVSNIVNLCSLLEVQVIALADHNTVANFPALNCLAKQKGILAVAAMEVTTQEDIHILCLFPEYEGAAEVQKLIWADLPKIKVDNRLYLPQRIVDEQDRTIEVVEHLLSVACSLDIYQLADVVASKGGICIPAHVDKPGSMLDVLGDIPRDVGYTTVEISRNCPQPIAEKLKAQFNVIVNSDAHDLETLVLSGSEIDIEQFSAKGVIKSLAKPKKN